MVGNALEQEIISLFAKDISSSYSINQIATKLGKKYPYINKKVTFLIKEKVFDRVVVGRSHLCSLNLDNDETVYLLILHEIRKKNSHLRNDRSFQQCNEYVKKISRTTSLELALSTKNEIIFVLTNEQDKEQLENGLLKQALQGYKISYCTKEEFLGRLLEDKALQAEHIILHGYEKFFEYVREIEDKIKLRYSKLMP